MTDKKVFLEYTAEDKRQYLAFIETTIGRMSSNSSSLKQWIIPVMALVLGAALNQKEKCLSYSGVLISLVFCGLDGYYLMLEKQFRELFKKAVYGEKDFYDMNYKYNSKLAQFCAWLKAVFSPATCPIYLCFIVVSFITLFCM